MNFTCVTTFTIHLCPKGWGQSAKLGQHSAIWRKLGTALQAYAGTPVPSFPQIPLLEKSTLKG